jgi:hypothetical protein
MTALLVELNPLRQTPLQLLVIMKLVVLVHLVQLS